MASALDEQSELSVADSLSEMPVAAGSPEPFSMPFQLGNVVVHKYKIIRLIGAGGVSFVVAARHIGFDEVVALKFLRPELASHTEAVSRFTIAARASFRIKSKHVARVLDVDTLEDGTPFIAMELLDGAVLRGLLDRCRVLAIEQAVDYALQTCEALAAAHALRIIHRNVKPENLFVIGRGDEPDQIKLLNFGTSEVALTSNTGQTNQAPTRIALRTAPYMSPEQVRLSSDLDERSDIWSLGCVMYELLSGNVPFDRLSLMQSCVAVLEEDPVPLRERRPMISQELDDVVMRCLQKDPCDRYQNVAELAVGLAPFGSKRFASYPERCRTLLAGEGLGRRATASAPTSASRYDSSPPDEAGSGRSSKLELVEPRRGLLPTGAQHPGGSPRGGTVEPHYAARIPPRSLPTVTGIPRLPTDGVGGDTSERRQGLLVAHPSLLYPQNATDSGLNLLSEPTLARLDANHGQRAAVQPSELRRTHNFVVTEEELLLQLRPRGWLWVVAGIAAIAFAAIYMSTQGQQPTSAYVARGAALGSSSAPSPRLKPEVISPSASQPAPISDVGNTVALQPSAAEAISGESEAPGAGAAAASDLPTRANSHRMDAPRARAKSSIKSSGSRKYDADDEVDVGF